MKILIVEDETGIAGFLRQGLEEEGFTVVTAPNGKIGIESYNSNKPDLVLLDWMLPIMTGLDVCKKIRETDETTPIIFLTAKDTVQETIEGLRTGANDYIKKPFSFDELLERIKIHFRPKKNDEVLTLGPIKLNTLNYEVRVNDNEVKLTQREFELLKYLIERKETVCSRNMIIEDVWDIHFEYDSGVIDVFINAIRKKLNLGKDLELIKTIRGVGYIASDK